MVGKIASVLVGTFLSVAVWPAPAPAQIINTNDVDAVCKTATVQTHRNTIVYVDLSSLNPGDKEWGYTILSKLELAPRERVTVLGVNPSNFEVLEVFGSCYPTWTASEIAKLRNERSFWQQLISEDPESQQRDNLQVFNSRLSNSLDKLLAAAKNLSLGKRRDILGGIAVDKNRFTEPNAFYRLIIFTNGSIQDLFETGANEAQMADLLIQKYPASFSGAEVFVFGVTGGERNEALETKEKIFSSFFLRNWAHVRSFTPSLPQQNRSSFSAVKMLTGNFDGGGIQGTVKLSWSTANDETANMWLTFRVGANILYVPVEGGYVCSAADCKVDGRITENVPLLSPTPYFRKDDKLALAGKRGERLTGTLSSETKEVFQQENATQKSEEVKYNLSFGALN